MGVLATIRVTDTEVSEEELETFSEEILHGMRGVLSIGTKRATGQLAESLKAHVYGKHIIVESDLAYADAVNKGTHASRSAWHLINKIVPLKLDSGKIIFRRVTLESILRGKWKRRPKQGMDFVAKGVRVASGSLRTRLNYVIER